MDHWLGQLHLKKFTLFSLIAILLLQGQPDLETLVHDGQLDGKEFGRKLRLLDQPIANGQYNRESKLKINSSGVNVTKRLAAVIYES